MFGKWKLKLSEAIEKIKDEDVLRAALSTFALASLADGDASEEEKIEMIKKVKKNKYLNGFKEHKIEKIYDGFIEGLQDDNVNLNPLNKNNSIFSNVVGTGKQDCYDAIDKLRYKDDYKKIANNLINICIGIITADGDIDTCEIDVLKDIISRLNLNQKDFGL